MSESPPIERIALCPGVRAARDRLWTEVAAQLEPRDSARSLQAPLRVLVPSRALREQLLVDWIRRAQRPLVGVRVDTFAGAAAEILRRAGVELASADALFPILVQRAIDLQPELAQDVASLRGRASIVAAPVADLLDAGLDEPSGEALDELLANLDGASARRARALVRLSLQVRSWLALLRWARPGDRLERAAAELDQQGARVFPAQRVWIYGVVDATGRLYDFLDAIVRQHDCRLIVDVPPDPMKPERFLTEYAERFVTRMGGALVANQEPCEPRGDVTGFRAAGADAEVREVAERVRAELDAGVIPEKIGVVARSLEGYATALRVQFSRLAIPFSGVDAVGPPDPAGLRTLALPELIRRGAESALDRWLDALGYDPELGSSATPEPRRNALRRDLSTAFHALGLGRLRDLAELDLEARLGSRDCFRLPVPSAARGRLEESGESPSPVEWSADTELDPADRSSGQVSRTVLEIARSRAARLVRLFEDWTGAHSAGAHATLLERLLRHELRYGTEVPGFERVREAREGLFGLLPEAFEMDRGELAEALEQQLRLRTTTAFGGAGGGVQVLDVTAARALEWQTLFVLGLNRSLFPRVVSEDPILPDSLRMHLAAILPELPYKARGHLEEEHLFAQLLSSSVRIVLSHQSVSDDGDERPVSLLLRRYQLAHPDFRAGDVAPPLLSPSASSLRPGFEHAVRAALHAPREDAVQVLRSVLEGEESSALRSAGLLLAGAELAAARFAVVAALDVAPHELHGFGGYLGRTGAVVQDEPMVAITTLEGMARCPWQTFLRKVLRLQAPPDALDLLPGLDARWIGIAAHAALESIVRRSLIASGRFAPGSERVSEPVSVPWPPGEELAAILREACRNTLIDAGLAFPGLMRALAELVRPLVEAARDLLWSSEQTPLQAYGAEVPGSFEVELADGRSRTVRFRADLAAANATKVRWIDFKTGSPLSTAARADTRHKHLVRAVARGTHLQALAYASSDPERGEGAYVFLGPDLAPEHALFSATRSDEELCRAFEHATAVLVQAWEAGLFFPRLIEPDRDQAPTACQYCEVAEACHQGDSGARLRLRRAAEHSPDPLVEQLWCLPLGQLPQGMST